MKTMNTSQFLNWLNNYVEMQEKAGNIPSFNDPDICVQLSKVESKYERKYLIKTHLCRMFKSFDKEEILLFYEIYYS